MNSTNLGYDYFFPQNILVGFGKETKTTAPIFQRCIYGTFMLTWNLEKKATSSHRVALGQVLRLSESQFPP